MMPKKNHRMDVYLLGVMGSVPGANKGMQAMGCNSSCMLVQSRELLFFDAGTGLLHADMGGYLKGQATLHLFLSHYHYDHIIGLPFWSVLYDKDCIVHIYGPELEGRGVEQVVQEMMKPPFLPMSRESFKARVVYHTILSGDVISFSEVDVLPFDAFHPGGGVVYVIRGKEDGPVVGYLTDLDIEKTDTEASGLSSALEGGAFIYGDAHFTLNEYNRHPDWGHSAIDHMIAFQVKCNIQLAALGHHAPDRSHSALSTQFDRAFLAFEGYHIALEWYRV